MDLQPHAQKLDFYQNTPRGRVLRTLTLNDLVFWGSDGFVVVILVLFVIFHLDGGSATHVGLGFFVYRGMAALLSIPAGRFFDKHRGYIDEVWGLSISSFIYGIGYMLLSFSSEVWQLYVAMAVLGGMSTINLLSWRTLFFNNIEKKEYTETIGAYQTVMFIGQGLGVALGGIVGDTFGFGTVVFYGGLAIFLGGFVPLGMRYLFEKETKRKPSADAAG